MRCPNCGGIDSRVVDSRNIEGWVRRRRQCLACHYRFTTTERVASRSLFVKKKDGRREEFLREKLLTGFRKACEKRPLPAGTVDKAVDDIENLLYSMGRAEVPSTRIGDVVMDRLKRLDHIAYIRFASVYREFADLNALKREVDSLSGPVARPAQLPLLPTSPLPTRRTSRKKA
ncbi:MAG: transcriptional regulator NrdR [Dehalococcoidia bacterium]|jgi:transcriptional repressor NrdR|nr:transcriptional regulator NrdR [Dehalococcoidia bacterium]MDP7469233.1 transcriptional regulator NrdR [Dehalococcoidia bacterium]